MGVSLIPPNSSLFFFFLLLIILFTFFGKMLSYFAFMCFIKMGVNY